MNTKDLVQDFKDGFDRGDRWGSVMSAWFDVAAILHNRGADIPPDWYYRPGAVAEQEVSDWHGHWCDADTVSLLGFGKLLSGLADEIREAGEDY